MTSRTPIARHALLILLLLPLTARAEQEPGRRVDLAGSWLGTLEVGPVKLRLGLRLTARGTAGATGTLVSIDQGGAVIPIDRVELNEGRLTIAASQIGGKYTGRAIEGGAKDADVLEGEWAQGGINAPLTFRRVDKLPGQDRPQNPKPPLPYKVEEVAFKNPNGGHTLAGTLTTPEGAGPFGAVVLVSGSGPQDRDETLMGHKPFLVLADALTRRGVAVLRYDDRGCGKSTGDHGAATSADFATDAISAIRYLAGRREVRADKIGLCGHSEGGLIGPMVAAAHPEEVAFLVLIAPPGVPGDQILQTQAAAMEKNLGVPPEAVQAMAAARRQLFDLARGESDPAVMRKKAAGILAQVPDSYFVGQRDIAAARKAAVASLAALPGPWVRYFMDHDPRGDLRRVGCPVLAVIGEKDLQVLPGVNLAPLRTALDEAPTKDVTVRELPGLNHLLQTAGTGMVGEYNLIEETIAPAALELIGSWTAERAGAKP